MNGLKVVHPKDHHIADSLPKTGASPISAVEIGLSLSLNHVWLIFVVIGIAIAVPVPEMTEPAKVNQNWF